MKTYKPQEITQPTEAPQPRLYTWDEVKSNEGVYKYCGSYLITIKNDHDKYTNIYYGNGDVETPAKFWGNGSYKFQKLENAKVIFDVIEGA